MLQVFISRKSRVIKILTISVFDVRSTFQKAPDYEIRVWWYCWEGVVYEKHLTNHQQWEKQNSRAKLAIVIRSDKIKTSSSDQIKIIGRGSQRGWKI